MVDYWYVSMAVVTPRTWRKMLIGKSWVELFASQASVVVFYSILRVLFCSVLFCSVLFCSVLFCSVLFCSVLRALRLCVCFEYASFYRRFQSFQSLFGSLFSLVGIAVWIYFNRLQNTTALELNLLCNFSLLPFSSSSRAVDSSFAFRLSFSFYPINSLLFLPCFV